jgi:GDP-L-fucose synthase
VLVTGGSGFLGRRLQKHQPQWIYISSRDCDLTKPNKVRELIGDYKPEAVIHLAARVGGIKDNIEHQADFYHINTMINTNVVHESYRLGMPRLLSSLSTCAFPEECLMYPFDEDSFFDGPPTMTNFSYGMSKRMLHVASMAYRNQYGLNYSTFCPSNIYGPGDHFAKENSHFVAALIHKVSSENVELKLWGTGRPLRQQLYVDDLCEIIPKLLYKHNTDDPLIVAPDENLSIEEMAKTLISQSGKDLKISFNGQMDGQYRKDGTNKRLKNVIGDFKFTTFKEGVAKTYEWYLENK